MSAVRRAPGANEVGAQQLVAAYERSVPQHDRRVGGVHYTPPALARFVVETAIGALGRVPRTICDPTCGAGSFLLAAADALADRGVDPVEVVEQRLVGGELDPDAAAVARDALERWVHERGTGRGGAGLRPRIEVGDTLLRAPDDWATRPAGGFDLVVGNPPFLSQLAVPTARGAAARTAVRERFGAVGVFADTAALFLLGSIDLVRVDGVVAMVQPQSFLAARDTAAVRAAALAAAHLTDVWSSDEELFEASVRVCVPVLRRAERSAARAREVVAVHWGPTTSTSSPRSTCREPSPTGEASWGPLFATALGLPRLRTHGGARLESLATATAGFRDEFYALLDAAVDTDTDPDIDPAVDTGGRSIYAGPEGSPPLITVGMIDPGRSTWGVRARRFGGRSQLAPRLDVAALTARSPRVAAWATARRVPKVLVATQTRVVEAVADPLGEWVPVTPTISVEPRLGPEIDASEMVWRLTAALLAPPVSVRALATHLGAGLSPGALRWSASSVLQVELPSNEVLWTQGAALVRELASSPPETRADLLDRLGSIMCRAHGLDADSEVHAWWLERAVRASR